MSGWAIATIVLGCLLLFSLVAIIDTGISDKWSWDNYLSIFLFIFLFPIFLPFAIRNWIFERKQKANSQTKELSWYDEGYKIGYEDGYNAGYDNGCIEGDERNE